MLLVIRRPHAGLSTQKQQVENHLGLHSLHSELRTLQSRNPTPGASSHTHLEPKLSFPPVKWEYSPPTGRNQDPSAPSQSPAHTSEELLFEKASSQAAWALALHSGQSGRDTPRVIEGDFPAGDPAPSSLVPEGPLLDLVWSPGPTGLGVGE